eukprot:CAMPEP_0183358596 /NCGR_PEP_ID=MMETSP0164_2-20130417/49718_1 /TAXON_ID=221442 /ORGANISM="Coccolithus pelagicus ssp braarudi, Strain PLY182g" /LENGTH=269 /DNA_ID=CAMNT_0025532519 /DNA_START=316 /DNA_END=1126 /DNA_ORIENTATION=-
MKRWRAPCDVWVCSKARDRRLRQASHRPAHASGALASFRESCRAPRLIHAGFRRDAPESARAVSAMEKQPAAFAERVDNLVGHVQPRLIRALWVDYLEDDDGDDAKEDEAHEDHDELIGHHLPHESAYQQIGPVQIAPHLHDVRVYVLQLLRLPLQLRGGVCSQLHRVGNLGLHSAERRERFVLGLRGLLDHLARGHVVDMPQSHPAAFRLTLRPLQVVVQPLQSCVVLFGFQVICCDLVPWKLSHLYLEGLKRLPRTLHTALKLFHAL